MSCASSGHITKLKQSIFAPFDIYGHYANLEMFNFIRRRKLQFLKEAAGK